MKIVHERFDPDPNRDYDLQLIEKTDGDGLIRCGPFMTCPVRDECWVGVGDEVVDSILHNRDLVQMWETKWPKDYGLSPQVFADAVARMRSFLRGLNTNPDPDPSGVEEEDVRFYVFSGIYKLIVPWASVDDVKDDWRRTKAGAKIVLELLEHGRPLRALSPEMVSATTGLLDASCNPTSLVAYGNILRATIWNLHYMLETRTHTVSLEFVQEVLRVRPPSGWPRREAAKDTHVLGHPIRQGEVVYCGIRATHLATGGDLDLRHPKEGKFSFGAGRHHCPVKMFSERALVRMLNGPGIRPVASVARVNAQYPEQQWP